MSNQRDHNHKCHDHSHEGHDHSHEGHDHSHVPDVSNGNERKILISFLSFSGSCL